MIDCPVCRSGDIEHAKSLSVPDVAAIKDCHPHTVRAAIKTGELAAKRVGRTFVVLAIDVDNWQPRQPGRPKEHRCGEARSALARDEEGTP